MPSYTRVIGIVAVCLLAVTAECAGVSGPGSDDGDPDDNSTNVEPYTAAGEELDFTALGQDHKAAIEAATSYTLTVSMTVGNDSAHSLVLNQTTSVAASGDVALAEQYSKVFGEERAVRYTEGDTTWKKTVRDPDGEAQTTYESASEPYSNFGVQPVNTSVSAGVGSGPTSVEWEQQGTVTQDGAGLTRYAITSVNNQSALPAPIGSPPEDLSNVRGTILVSADGLIYRYSLAYDYEGTDGETQTMRLAFETSDVDSTTVEKPDWTADV